MNRYYPRNQVRIDVSFTDVATGALADPSTINIEVIDPTGTKTVYTSPAVVRASQGKYYTLIYVVTEGKWQYAGVGTGAVIAASEGEFVVAQSEFVP